MILGMNNNKVIRPKSRASAFSEKSGRQTDEQTKTFKKTFELATKSLKNNFVTYQWTDGLKFSKRPLNTSQYLL